MSSVLPAETGEEAGVETGVDKDGTREDSVSEPPDRTTAGQ